MSTQRIVGASKARKIAQEKAAKQLEIDIQCLKNYEIECQKGEVSTETFAKTMDGASIEAQKYATNIKNGTGSAQTFATNQKVIQSSMNETSIVSKIAATGLNLFKAALKSLIFFAVIEGIQLLVKGIDSLILTADEAEEKAENLRSNMKSFFDEVQSGQQTISSISDRFSELSKHVTETGANIDLVNDDYSEYLDICNQVKSIMPELVSGYTNEGNAIITLKDNVNNLTEAYKENIRYKAEAFVSNGDENGNTIQSFFDDYKIFAEGEGGLFAPSAGGLWNNKSTDYEDYYGYDKVHKWLSDVADLSLEDLQNLQKGTTQATYLYALLKENGYELANITKNNYEAVHDVLNMRLTSLESEMTTRVSNIKMSLQQMLYADADYWDIDDKETLSAIDSLFSDVDAEFIKQNNLLGKTALQSFESNVIKLFKNKNTQQAMVDIYTPQGQEESINNYSKRVNNGIQEIQDYVTDNGIDIPLNFSNVTNNVDELKTQYESAIEQTKQQFAGETSAATEVLKTAQKNLQDEYQKIEDWGLGDYVEQIKNGTIQSVFGNVDMDNREVIYWTTETIEEWKDALSDIKYYDKDGNFLESYYDQLKESAENGYSTIDTVFGDVMDYIEGYDGITTLSFSHIVNNDDGTFEFLGQKTAEEYLYGILDVAKQDGDMSIDHILELDKKGLENVEVYDAEGKVIGQTYVHGIISGFNENADDVSKLTHFAGDFGAINLAEQAIEDAKKMQEDFDWDSWFKENSINTKEEIDNWLEIAQAANSAAEARERYTQGAPAPKVSFSSLVDEDSAFKENIDSYIEKVEKLGKALTAYKSKELSGSELTELIEEFPQLASRTGDLDDAILELLDSMETDIIEKFSDQFGNMETADDINALQNLKLAVLSVRDGTSGSFDFTDVVSGIEDVLNGLDKLVDATDKLKEGTALTKYELANLALEYPKLLTVSGLFTDGSISGQQKMLDNLLDIYEAEYNATIDTKIAELKATNEALKSAIDLELDKAEIITDIKAQEVSGSAEYQAWLAEKLNEFNNLEGQNYVIYSDGILSVNKSMLDNMLQQEAQKEELSAEYIWKPQAVAIADSFAEGGKSGLKALDTTGTGISKWITSVKNNFKSMARTIANALKGVEYDDGMTSMTAATNDITSKLKNAVSQVSSNIESTVSTAISKLKLTVNYTNVDEWANDTEEIIQERINQIREQIEKNDIAIENLEALKGLDLKELYKAGKDSKSSSSSSSETFDWIEIKIKTIERAIENLNQTASATYKSWSVRNKALSSELSKVADEISVQQQAYTRYMKQANSVGLSSTYKKLVQQGAISISTISDEKLAKKISEYQKWYEAALDAKDAVQDLKDELADLSRQQFDNVAKEYEDKLSDIEHQIDMLDSQINKIETSGHIAGSQYYEKLISQQKKNKTLLEKEYAALQSQLEKSMKSGDISKFSEEWYSMMQSIQDVEQTIVEADTSLLEFQNSLRDMKWDAFDRLQEDISDITSEAEFLISLMQNSDLYDEQGNFTDAGMATMGLHGQSYNVYMAQADKYADEIKKLEKDYADDLYNTDYLERRQELLELQQDSILAANDEKQAIIDLVGDGISTELDALDELIQKYKDAMNEAQDLYDYQKQVSDATKEVNSLQKQLLAYEKDDSEEAKAKIQSLKVELESAQENLEETEMQHALNETEKLLDSLYDEYESLFNSRLDEVDVLFEEMIAAINANSSSIAETLFHEAENVGYNISDNLQNIWGNDGSATSVITKYGDDFCLQLTSVNSVLNTINENLIGLYAEPEEAEKTDNSTQSNSSSGTLSGKTNNSSNTTSTTTSNKNTAIAVGGKIYAGNAKIYDYVGDKSGETQYYKKDPIYTVLAEKNGYLKVRHHKLSKGVSGWFKKSDVKAYKTGGLADETGFAWLDGTKNKPELVLNQDDTKNFMELTNTLRQLTQEEIQSLIPSTAASLFKTTSPNIPNYPLNAQQNMNNTFHMNFEVNDVKDGEEFINYLIKNDRFEKAIESMTVNKLVGGSKLAKNKYIR